MKKKESNMGVYADLMEALGKGDTAFFLPEATIKISKETMKRAVAKCKSLEELQAYIQKLGERQTNLRRLKDRTANRMQSFVKKNEGSRLLFHASFIEAELGEMHYISNLSDMTTDEMAELLFRNCQMSQVYRDAVVKAYQLCKKAGIDKGDIQKIV